MLNIYQILDIIEDKTDKILVKDELIKKLKKNKPLIIKFGCDPTAPDIHLGHTIVINKLRQFQKLGHNIHFLIGDFTAQIGDPTGRNIARPVLTSLESSYNAKNYSKQIFKFLDKNKTVIHYNSFWFNKMSAYDIIKLASKSTLARIIERDDFSNRYKNNKSISIIELLYPLLQGYDSVVINSDIEIGGADQKFNLLMGREIQKQYNQEPQVIITMPILEGLDGVKKMSKSNQNYISIEESANEMFGKIMSISDKVMWNYYKLLSCKSLKYINELKNNISQGIHLRNIKLKLAKELTERFHSKINSEEAYKNFIKIFQNNSIPNNISTIKLQEELLISSLLKKIGLVKSISEANRMIKFGAVRVNGQKINNNKIIFIKGTDSILQIGKRKFKRVIIK